MNIFGKSTQSIILYLGVIVLFLFATESFEDEPTIIHTNNVLQAYDGRHDANLPLIYNHYSVQE